MSKHYETGSEYPELKKGTLRLYSMRFCPYAQRSRLVLIAKNIPAEIINIHLQKKPEWFTERTPVGAVPVLEHDDGRILYESLIICDYLDTIYPTNRLTPSDPFVKAQHQILIELFSSRVIGPFYKIMRSTESDPAKDLIDGLEFIQGKLEKDYFGGDSPAMVDYMVWPWFERLALLTAFGKLELDKSKFQKTIDYIERMKQLPAVKETYTESNVLAEFYKGYLAGNAVYDF